MTAVQPGLNPRDSQILELLRGGAPVQRVVAIGRHRKSWTALHVGNIVAFHLEAPAPILTVVPQPEPPRKVAECGTLGGHNRHRRHREEVCDDCAKAKRDYQREWSAARSREAGARVTFTEWHPEPYTGRATRVELTPGQLDVFRELCRGLSNGRIAIALGITEDTVKAHMKAVLIALGATDRTHAVVRVLTGQVRVQVRRSARDGVA